MRFEDAPTTSNPPASTAGSEAIPIHFSQKDDLAVTSAHSWSRILQPLVSAPVRDRWILAASITVLLLVCIFGWLSIREFRHSGTSPTGQAEANALKRPPPGQPIAANSPVDWSADKDGNPKVYSSGSLSLTLSSRPGNSGEAPYPQLSLVDETGGTFEVLGQQGFQTASATFAVGRVDPQAADDQVLFSTFSGGAHCCAQIVLIEKLSGTWRRVDLGSWDGDGFGEFPKDVDGDGIADIVFRDQRFAYAFTSYAASVMPPQVFNVVGGRVVDVSNSPRYARVYDPALNDAENGCIQHNNGACAAYIAIAARLGRRDEAWQQMLGWYDSTAQWTWPTACAQAVINGKCPDGQAITFRNFPSALAWFLVDAGYPWWDRSMSATPQRTPTYNCAKVQSVNLKLICATPLLSQLDHQLGEIYARAMATNAAPDSLRNDQRQWIANRNAAAPDIDLLASLYMQRISQLQGLLPA